MSKNVYILDEYVSSAKNGIGTFMKGYIYCLKKIGANICVIVFNAECSEFTISFHQDIQYMMFPKFPKGEFINHPDIVDKFFQLYIKDSPENIFCFNHAPCDKLLYAVRQSHPLSKLFFFIHDQLWTGVLKGNDNDYRRIILNKNSPEIRNKYKHVISFHEVEKRMYELVDAVISLSPSTYGLLLDIYDVTSKNKFWLIPNGLKRSLSTTSVAREKLRKQFCIGNDEKIILYVGRLTELKGINALYKAFDSVVKEHPLARLVIIGQVIDGNLSSSLNRSLARITYTGLLKPIEVRKWYQMADVGVIPSYTEQCSYVGIEMMMHGLPIVASGGFGVRDMFKDGENAIVAPIGRRTGKAKTFSENLAQALISMLSSAELREKMGRNAREVYLKCYSLAKMKEGYKRLFDALE